MSSDPHDAAFFEQMRSCREPYRRLADCIHEVVGQSPTGLGSSELTAIDIGCGIGLQTARLKELGWNIRGAEYTPVAIEMQEPGIKIETIDLTAHSSFCMAYDCVICTETAEHIPAEYSLDVVDNVARRALHTIVWSAAAPGQEWEGHINLQRPEYWLTRFRMHGWDLDEDKTAKLRYLMSKHNAQHVLGKENFCVLRRVSRPLHMTIISTVLNGEKWIERHIDSVDSQTFSHYTHLVIDAQSEDNTRALASAKIDLLSLRDHRLIVNDTRKAALENCYEAWKDLPDDEVVVWLDGDDWLAHDRALEVLALAYCSSKEPWLTFGQFMFPDGEVGFARAYEPGMAPRYSDWRATHLKTFRAGLVKKLDPSRLQKPDGSWVSLAIDKAVMWPLLEMAGERYTTIPQVLSVYNLSASWWAAQTEASRAVELAEVERLRSLPPEHRLTERPWIAEFDQAWAPRPAQVTLGLAVALQGPGNSRGLDR